MIKINIHEAKANLSCYLERIAKGETIILCKRNISIAKIRPIPPDRKSQRPIGLAAVRIPIGLLCAAIASLAALYYSSSIHKVVFS